MKPFFMALAVLCVVSCAKPKQSVDPVINNDESPETPNSTPVLAGSQNFPFAFQPDEAPTGYVVRLQFDPSIEDYSTIMTQKCDEVLNHGGGTLVIPYGTYTIKKTTQFKRDYGPAVSFAVVGERGPNGELPIISYEDQSIKPFRAFMFVSNYNAPQMSISVRNLEFRGNNSPYSSSHPFYGPLAQPRPCISGYNIVTANIKNVVIKNHYGDGIVLTNEGTTGRNKRIESPVIKSCKILNCWSDDFNNWDGDGIMLWAVNKPIVEGCIIDNDVVNTTHYYPRCGIVMEHSVEDAVIKNNYIGGYTKLLHIECDYGGHVIEGNKFVRDKISSILFVQNCGQNPADGYKPTKILNNEFLYDQTYQEYGADHRCFIYMNKSFTLDGSIISGNKFTFAEKNSSSDRQHYINTTAEYNVYIQKHGQENLTISNNQYN